MWRHWHGMKWHGPFPDYCFFSLDLNIVGNIWDNGSTQNNTSGFCIFQSKKILHIVPLIQNWVQTGTQSYTVVFGQF